VQQPERARRPAAHALARLADGGVVAVGEGNGGEPARLLGELDDPPRGRGVERERLLADDVLAGGQGGLGERDVQVVGRADVHDVDLVRGGERLGRGIGPVGAELCRGGLGALRRGGGDADEVGPRQARGAGVDGTDEPGSCDGDPELCGHAREDFYSFDRLSSKSPVRNRWKTCQFSCERRTFW